MTIPEDGADGSRDEKTAPAPPEPAPSPNTASPSPRPKLNETERKIVYRRKPTAPKAPATLRPGVEETARVVQLAYSVIGENIKQGRDAAEKLRQGDYHISDAPADLDTAGRRVLDLAREFSATTLTLGERLLDEVKDILGPVSAHRRGVVPAFRDLVGKAAASSTEMADAARLKLTVRFDDKTKAKAKAHTYSIERPKPQTPVSNIRLAGGDLVARSDGAKLGATVTFNVDLAIEGLIAEIDLSNRTNLNPGLFAGSVCVQGDTVPLGTLTIEIVE